MSFADRARQILGPRPEGDPAQMRASAAALEGIAAELENQAHAMQATAVPGAGPLVVRTNARASARARRLASSATDARQLAARLKHQAGTVEQAQHAYDGRLTQQIQLLAQNAEAHR